MVTHGRRLAHLRFAPEESPYPLIAMVPQSVTERLLVEQLARKGGAVEYETALVSADRSGRSRDAPCSIARGERTEVTAAFVVGCDGAHSTVRHLLNLPFAGAEYEDSFMLADIETNDALPADELQLCPSESGPLAIFPMSATRRRIVATVSQIEGEAPSLELVRQATASACTGRNSRRTRLHWSSYFRIYHRHAAQLRVGRCFIAGDAAHIHSPYGGQGMNTGLHDVWNLVWKLDLVLHGRGNEQLLDSYGAERLPVIEQRHRDDSLLTRVMSTPHRWAQILRDTMIPMMSRLAPFQHAFVERLSELGIAYRDSPIVDGSGERYFDDSLRGGNGIRSRFLLICDEAADTATHGALRELARSLSDVVELRLASHPGISLVRPDGYIAYAAHSRDGGAALKAVRALLERQTQPSAVSSPV